jgi:hypothetical protein
MINELINLEKMSNISNKTINDHAQKMIQMIDDGEIDPLTLALQIKYIEELIDIVKPKLRDEVITKCNQYSKGENIIKYGSEFKIKESATKYNFNNCNDPLWNEYNNKIKEADEIKKSRETFLKNIKEKFTIVDEDTGETFEIHPPMKTSTTTYSINIPKE